MSAVIASAVEDALGFRIDAMPLSPSILFGLRNEFAAGRVEPTAIGRARAGHPAEQQGEHPVGQRGQKGNDR